MTTPPRKWALITNHTPIDSLTSALTTSLLDRGINVIATSPSTTTTTTPSPSFPSPSPTPQGFFIHLPLDSTTPLSLLTALDKIYRLTDGTLSLLINASPPPSLPPSTPLLSADLDLAKRDHESRVWGMLAVTQAFFPLLRTTGRGIVVNEISIGAMGGGALEGSGEVVRRGLSEGMRAEFAGFGVRVVGLVTSRVDGALREMGDEVWWGFAEGAVEALLGEDVPDYVGDVQQMGWLWRVLSWFCPAWMMDLFLVRVRESESHPSHTMGDDDIWKED